MKDRDKFLDEEIKLGTWLSTGSSVIAELASQFSFDWFLLDLEHGSFSESQLMSQMRSITNAHIIVRVPDLTPSLISRVLDWGADGIMLPHVSSPQQARDCVSAMRYPPFGNRGYSSTVRAYQYGLEAPSNPSEVKPICIVQIEDRQGVLKANEIASVEGVDMLFVGPADLKLDLSYQSSNSPLEFNDALLIVAEAAKDHRKRSGILLREKSLYLDLKNIGYTCLAVDSDLGLLRKGYTELINWHSKFDS